MEDILLGHSGKGSVVDTMMGVETLVLSIDEGLPEYGIHLFVSDRRTILAEELADGLAVGAVDDRGLSRTFVLDGRHGRRLSEEPKEIDIDGNEIEEKQHYERHECRKCLYIPRTTFIKTFVCRPNACYPTPNLFHDDSAIM